MISSESENFDKIKSTHIQKNIINSENIKEKEIVDLSTVPKQTIENTIEGNIISTIPKKKNLRDGTTFLKSTVLNEKR